MSKLILLGLCDDLLHIYYLAVLLIKANNVTGVTNVIIFLNKCLFTLIKTHH